MLNAERREAIKRKITTEQRVLIQDLCKEFNTSPVTIRKDLDALEGEGILTRVHGGGIVKKAIEINLSISEKEKVNLKEKERIANFAVNIIKEGDVIILDSGFTAVYIARRLRFRSGIKIITGGLNVANEIIGSENQLILTGGVFNLSTFGLSGGFAENVIKNTVADKLFLGVDGVDFEKGLSKTELIISNGKALKTKLEGICIKSSADNKTTVITVSDNDDGTSWIYEMDFFIGN